MNKWLLASLVVLVVLIVGFLATRQTALPLQASVGCTSNASCPAGRVCTSGICTDPGLGAALTEAQTAARNVTAALQAIQLSTSTYSTHVALLEQAMSKAGVAAIPSSMYSALQQDTAALAAAIGDYRQQLTGVGGYVALMNALTPSSSTGELFGAVSAAPAVSAPSIPVTSAIAPIVADLLNILLYVDQAVASTANLSAPLSLSSGLTPALSTVANDHTLAALYATAVQTTVDNAAQTGNALYNRLITV